MNPLHSLIEFWSRLRSAARHEFLRDPDVVLFERAAPKQESLGGR